jgi:1-acyl-sn-glycerol-3-phosphate acyltransferase
MIRRAVRKSFRGVYWIPPAQPLPEPSILVPNHHGWHDGYVMYHAITAMKMLTLDWIQEFDSFPLFSRVGGMPFPADDAARRGVTIRKTIRLMNAEKRNLLLFAEQQLHRPPEIMPFGKALEVVAGRVTDVSVVPVAIRYEMSMHERPECFLHFGAPVKGKDATAAGTRLAVKALLDEIAVKIRFEPQAFQTLAEGTKDVNERMDMRQIPGIRKK